MHLCARFNVLRSVSLRIWFWILGSCAALSGFAQGGGLPAGFGGVPAGAAGAGSGSNLTVVLDTSRISYHELANPNIQYDFTDSTLSDFQHFDPVRTARPFDYAHLGNLGSAHRQLVFQPDSEMGLRIGFRQFDLYRIRTEELRFYNITQAYTHAYYAQGSAQEDAYFKARFSRNFSGGLNLALDYRAINNVGGYEYQKARDNSLGIGFWIKGSPRYSSYLTYVGTTIQQQNPGGYNAPRDTTEVVDPINVLALSSSRQSVTLHQHREAAYTQFFRIGRDSTGRRRQFGAYHQLRFTSSNYKFSDTRPDEDFYPARYFVDERGLRNFIAHNQVQNTFRLRTFRLNQNTANTSERDLLEFGLRHTYHRVREESADSTANNLFATARIGFTLSDRLRLQTDGQLGLAGDYRLRGLLVLDFQTFGQLEAELINQLRAPSLVETRFFVTGRSLWRNDFRKTLGTHLRGTYRLPRFDLTVGAQYHLLTNSVYFGADATPQQLAAPVSVLQFMIEKNLRLGQFHLDNQIVLQTTTQDVLRLPGFYGRHSVYWQGRIFRGGAMLFKSGFDARLVSGYRADRYFALTGQFHLQDDTELGFQPLIDFFLTFKVDKFRFFARMDNLLPYLTFDYYELTTDYALPQGFETGLRLGVSWRFVD